MKLRSISNAYRIRSPGVSSKPLDRSQLVRDPVASSSPERAPYVQYWKRPAAILEKSKIAARKAYNGARRFNGSLSQDAIEDVAQDLAAQFYAITEFEQPQTEVAFELWALKTASSIIAVESRRVRRQRSDVLILEEGEEASLIDLVTSRLDYLHRSHKPQQDIRCEALDAVRMIGYLAEADQRFVWDIIASEDVVGYAQDHGVSLFEAMGALKRARVIMNRISDDLADERKELADVA